MPVIIHDFTGIADLEDYYRGYDYRIIRERDIEGTRGYLDPCAGSKLMEQIHNESLLPAFHFLDSGNYHYMTRLYASLINEPYDLVVYDNHTDMQESAFGDILSCGSWIADLLKYDRKLKESCLSRVFLIGAKSEYIDALNGDFDGKVNFAESYDAIKNLRNCDGNRPAYISIDKDVLSDSEFICDWDQGEMSLSELITDLRHISTGRRIIGVDVCGEPEPEDIGNVEKSSRINREILMALDV